MDQKRYIDIRRDIKSGDIVAWQGRFTNRRLLKLFNQKIGHVGIAWVISNRVFIIHALTQGIVINPLSRLTPFIWLATETEWSEETQVFALSELGRSYSYVDVLRSVIGMPSDTNNGWMCGEFARAVLQQAKLPVTQDFPSKLIDEVLSMNPNIEMVELL
ncbi:MAG: hypothetical protein COA99_07430 [Moraxellaceae bacterium]|nr:MAG: hypothetical protein COA99_07430 [Moraxellaceae bacterium]